jgi:superfamily II DNA or RNA helicase/sulfur relay (sulfurtransferase) DsrC/TusE family protein
MHDIIDNSKVKLVDVLKEKLSVSKRARFAVGWLFISGFKELKDEIEKLEKLEILSGSRTNKQTAEIMLLEKKWNEAVKDKLENLKYLPEEEREKILNNEFKELVNDLSYIKPSEENIEFLKWFLEKLREKKIEIRIYYKEPLHAKLYLFEYKDKRHGLGEAIVGSSNFSLSGFELNTELNVRVLGNDNYKFLNDWFEKKWQESELTQFTELAEKAIEKSWAFNKEVTPFRVYLRVLHEMFSYKEPEPDIYIEAELYRFQKDAVISAYKKLKKYNGVFISDVPGLGKTYIGSALLSHLETEGKTAIVIAPPRLVEYWREVLIDLGVSKTRVFSMGKLEEILDDERYMKRKVVLVDESHHFRNPETKRYKDLLKICQDKQVILLSATPQNLSIWDIYWQLKLFTPYETNHNFRIYPIELKKYFEACERGDANIEDLISEIFIRRTRSDIKEYYPDEKIVFPERKGPYRVDYSIDDVYEGGLYAKIQELLNKLTYARYNLSRYVKEIDFEPEEFQRLNNAWVNLQRLVRANLYRRLESSVQAFRDSIDRHLKVYNGFKEILIRENKIPIGDINDLEEMIDKLRDDEEFEWRERENYYDAKKFEVEKLKEDLEKDIKVFTEIKEAIKDITPKDDDKLQKLIEILNKEPIKGKKVVIFSAFESTVKYLYENLKDRFEKVDYVAGGERILTKIKRFAPKANKAKINPEEEIQILIATEILSEGLNLQDAQVVINYELHWNPVRIIQRIGRIDRIGSEHSEIYVYNFFPETKAEKEIKIEDKVNRRINEIIQNFGYDEKTIHLEEPVVRKKLFEIYTEKPEGLEEPEEKSDSKYFEFEFYKLIKEYPEEYKLALELPAMVNVAKYSQVQGLIVFCKAGNYYRLKLTDLKGDVINSNDWEILKLLECKPNEKGYDFNKAFYEIIEKTREEFEKEANKREREKLDFIDPQKREIIKFIDKLKRKKSKKFKERCDELINLVKNKFISYENGKRIRKFMKDLSKKFGLPDEKILEELEKELKTILLSARQEEKPKIEKVYAQIIIVEELIKK